MEIGFGMMHLSSVGPIDWIIIQLFIEFVLVVHLNEYDMYCLNSRKVLRWALKVPTILDQV